MSKTITKPCETYDEVLGRKENKGLQNEVLGVLEVFERDYIQTILDACIIDGKVDRSKITSLQKQHLGLILNDPEMVKNLNIELTSTLEKLTIVNPTSFADMKKNANLLRANYDLFHNAHGETDITKIMKWLAGDEQNESVESQSDSFCGIAVDKLTEDQKKLFNKLSVQERKGLSDRVRHNPEQGQFEFSNTARGSLAIQDKDSGDNVNKSKADAIAQQAGKGWKLPEDISSRKSDKERLSLHPQDSDFDAMIDQMPGANDNEKVENFRLLTGMSEWYWTGTFYDKSSSGSVIRSFRNSNRSRGWSSHHSYGHVRLVRSLEVK